MKPLGLEPLFEVPGRSDGAGALGLRRSFSPEPALVADPVDAYAVSETGSLVWRVGSSSRVTQLTWFDRTGKILAAVGEPGEITNPVLSPDGKRLLITIRDPVVRTRDI